MIRVCETKDRFEVRAERLSALLRDAGVSEHGPRTARPTFLRGPSPRFSCNIVIEWLRAKHQPLREYLAHLIRFDLGLHRSLGKIHRERDATLRLALALFIDFAHAQGLNAVELVALMSDAQSELLDAIEFLLLHAAGEGSLPGAASEDRDEPWGDAPAITF